MIHYDVETKLRTPEGWMTMNKSLFVSNPDLDSHRRMLLQLVPGNHGTEDKPVLFISRQKEAAS